MKLGLNIPPLPLSYNSRGPKEVVVPFVMETFMTTVTLAFNTGLSPRFTLAYIDSHNIFGLYCNDAYAMQSL